MKIQDIIRNMIELIDNIESTTPQIQHHEPVKIIQPVHDQSVQAINPISQYGDDINRFRQIVDLANIPSEYSNEPDEKYAGLDSVTIHAGGGLNGPKHPADIRVKDPSATPHLIGQDFESKSLEQPAHVILIKTLGEL